MTYVRHSNQLFVAMTLWLCAVAAHAQQLTLNTPIARELKADEAHNYELKLPANQYAYVVVMQQGVDAQVSVYDPSGKLVISMDSPNGNQGPEPVWLINQAAGAYRVEVKPFTAPNQAARGGKYEITLATLRASTPADTKVGQALAAYVEGIRLSVGPPDEAKRKAAVDKMQQALRLLSEDGDAELRQTVRRGAFAVAPLYVVQDMKGLTKVPGAVTIYHSADNGPLAKDLATRFGSFVSFYQPRLKIKATPTFVMLNKADWASLSVGTPFGMPLYTPDPPAMIASSDVQAVSGMLAMFKGKAPDDLLSALVAEGLSYETNAAPLVIEAGAGILVGMDFSRQILGRMPKPWMDVVLGSYLLHAWLGEKQTPQLARQYRLGIRIPGAVMMPSVRGLDAIFSSGDAFTQGVAFSRAATLGAQLYDAHKLRLLDELIKAFPKNTKVDAATAEARLYQLSPHFKPWVESFDGKTASNNEAATTAEQDLRAKIELMRQAIINDDKAFFEQTLVDNYIETTPETNVMTKAEFLKDWTAAPAEMKRSSNLADIQIIPHGDVAIASYRLNFRMENKGQLVETSFRVTDTWQRRGNNWRLLAEHAMYLPRPRAVASVPVSILEQYVGGYGFAGMTSTLTREGNTLIEQFASSTTKNVLLPESETTFFIEGRNSTYTFVKDAQGKVTHFVVRMPNGQEMKVNKIK